MAKFIVSSIKKVDVSYSGEHKNHPVNIDLCSQLSCSQHNDGYGNIFPTIEFSGIPATWIYPKDKTNLRDSEYENILKNNS